LVERSVRDILYMTRHRQILLRLGDGRSHEG
jgi:hypothetical protein